MTSPSKSLSDSMALLAINHPTTNNLFRDIGLNYPTTSITIQVDSLNPPLIASLRRASVLNASISTRALVLFADRVNGMVLREVDGRILFTLSNTHLLS